MACERVFRDKSTITFPLYPHFTPYRGRGIRFQQKLRPFVRLYPILCQEPIFETGCRKMSGFLLHSAQKSGQIRIAGKSDAIGYATPEVDLCTTLSHFFDRNGLNTTLTEMDGL